MTTEFMVHIGSPGGAAVQRQLAGKVYSVLPAGPSRCVWHRTYRRGTLEPAESGAPPPCESPEAWPHVEGREEALKWLPCYQLPDLRSVVFVPHVPQFGAVFDGEYSLIFEREYSLIRAAAKALHKRAVTHGYDVALEILQCWKKHGPRIAQAVHEQSRRIREGTAFEYPPVPVTDLESWLPNWISVHAPHLTDRDATKAFVPHIEACAVMLRATGKGMPGIRRSMVRKRSASRNRPRR